MIGALAARNNLRVKIDRKFCCYELSELRNLFFDLNFVA